MGVLCVKGEGKDNSENGKLSSMKEASPLNTIQTKMGIFPWKFRQKWISKTSNHQRMPNKFRFPIKKLYFKYKIRNLTVAAHSRL